MQILSRRLNDDLASSCKSSTSNPSSYPFLVDSAKYERRLRRLTRIWIKERALNGSQMANVFKCTRNGTVFPNLIKSEKAVRSSYHTSHNSNATRRRRDPPNDKGKMKSCSSLCRGIPTPFDGQCGDMRLYIFAIPIIYRLPRIIWG